VRNASNAKWGGAYRAVPSGDWSITTKVTMNNEIPAAAQEFDAGIILMEGTGATSDLYAFALRTQQAAIRRNISVARWSDYQTFNANAYASEADGDSLLSSVYLRVFRASGVYFYEFSTDGLGWTQLFNHTPAFTVAQIGLGAWAGSSRTLRAYFRFWRQTSTASATQKLRGQTLNL
jgi:hypothetical protein